MNRRMLKDRTFDPLGCVAGISFLISGILVIQKKKDRNGFNLFNFFFNIEAFVSIVVNCRTRRKDSSNL